MPEIMDLHVYYAEGTQSSEVYEDAGEYYGYEQGNYRLRVFSLEVEGKDCLYSTAKSWTLQ